MATSNGLDYAVSPGVPSRDEIMLGYCARNHSGQPVSDVYDTVQEVLDSLRGFEGYQIGRVCRVLYAHEKLIWDIPTRNAI